MEYRLPYYMTYPMPMQYDDEKTERRDFEYMKSMYPDMARRILPFVEEECDRMEYEGSMMYDEYPDQLQLRMMCSRIYNRVRQEEDMGEPEDADVEMEQNRRRGGQNRDDVLRELVNVILFQELFKRRGERRRRRRLFY